MIAGAVGEAVECRASDEAAGQLIGGNYGRAPTETFPCHAGYLLGLTSRGSGTRAMIAAAGRTVLLVLAADRHLS